MLWVRNDEVGATVLSGDATTYASVAGVDGQTLGLSTRWTQASLATSDSLVVPTQTRDYIQVKPNAEFSALLALHREGVDVLRRIYGAPLLHVPPTVDALNALLSENRKAFLSRRYRQPAKLVAFGGYGLRLSTRFGLGVPAWLLALAAGSTWLLVIGALIAAITWESALALVIALGFLLPAVWLTVGLLRRRRAGV